MKPLTQEWVDKAEGDFVCVKRELSARKAPNYDAACFHAQQCAEKYFKARLQEVSISFSKIHDLEVLLKQIYSVEPLWTFLMPAAKTLTEYAVKFRYPGDNADRDEAKQALKLASAIREEVRRLGLPI